MNYLHPVFALCLFLEAFAVLWLINQWFRIEPVSGHAPEIDGLRGLLAFGVFVHHASIWYFFLQTGRWVVPESNHGATQGNTSSVPNSRPRQAVGALTVVAWVWLKPTRCAP